ncbi:cytochrome p450 domain-containing protein [Phthorimaea operculella]|nr:cytochrome p450 domain-containing protein [Phthorimaea operculella]
MLERELSISNVLYGQKLIARYTIDCIGSVVFGINTDTMGKDITKNPFMNIADLIFENSNIRGIAIYTRLIWPSLFYGVGLYMFPKSVYDFFRNLISGVFKERGYKPSMRHDFVDLLLNLKQQDYITTESILKSKKGETVSLKIDDELLIAQVVLFFGAGFETSSATTSFALFQLAKNQDAQKRAREEINDYLKRKGGKVDYDCTAEMPYLDACIEESMRLYPALGIITREVMDTYELPSGLILEPGTSIHLPVYHLHHNPEYFPDPEQYRPERFLPENKAHIIPYTYMPFGEGQRICLGVKVAKMMMIPGLMTVLRKYRVELADGMTQNLKMEPRAILTMSVDQLKLKFIPLDK